VFGACVLLVYFPVNVGIVKFLRACCIVMPGGKGAPTVETPPPVLQLSVAVVEASFRV